MDVSDLLSKTKLFAGVDGAALREIARFTARHIFDFTYGQDRVIISEKDSAGPDLYLILSGEVTINRELDHRGIRLRKRIETLEDEVYGEIAWLLKQKHLSDVYTRSRVVLLRIDGARLDSFLEANPEVAAVFWKRIAETVAKRLTWTFMQYRSTLEWDKIFKF
ncbi:MAG: cyclic nucleotide-binding domain-containing protein [Magnetococcales bacterium]|nr:cyclic nucleotide-binding domain-containing protein [Magnetococcales bacterium]